MTPFTAASAICMRRPLGAACKLVCCLCIAVMMTACARTRIERVTYGPWPDSYRIHNQHTEVIVVPATGRVMRYGWIGRDNALWEMPQTAPKPGWANVGGDKIWFWPQEQWIPRTGKDWPPTYGLDGAPHEVEIIGNDTLRISSPIVKGYGVRVIRDITLAPSGTRVTIRNQLMQDPNQPGGAIDTLPQIWTVTQIPIPTDFRACVMEPETLPRWKQILGLWPTPVRTTKRTLTTVPPRDTVAKIGVRADALAAAYPGYVFHQRLINPIHPARDAELHQSQLYIDSSYTDGLTGIYAEMEFTAPPGCRQLTIEWQLCER